MTSLSAVFDGWEGYNASIIHAVEQLTPEQLAWRPAPGMSSIGEVAAHIAFGRIGWFHNMGAPRAEELALKAGGIDRRDSIAQNSAALVEWLQTTWEMVAATLSNWTVDDLQVTYPHTYWGRTYAVSRQWTLFRILAHDIHHGGQLSVMLGMLGIEAPELIALGGHITEPPLWEEKKGPAGYTEP